MAARRSLDDKVLMIFLYGKFENYNMVSREWNKHSDTPPPKSETVANVVKHFKDSGNVDELQRSGRPATALTEDKLQMVKDTVETDSKISTRRGAIATGISQTSYRRALDKLDFKVYRPTFVVQLTDDDFDRRLEFCDIMLQKFTENAALVHDILWSDEAKFLLNGTVNRRDCHMGTL